MKKGLRALLIILLVLLLLGGAAYGAHYWAGRPEILVLSDEGPFEVEYGSEFTLPTAEGKFNLTEVAAEGSIDTTRLGTQTVTYRYLRVEKTVTVTVVDTVRPVIKLLGDAEMSIRQVDPYVEPGFTAWDNVDGDITDRVVIKSDLNTKEEGFYTITYEVFGENAGANAKPLTKTEDAGNIKLPLETGIYTIRAVFSPTSAQTKQGEEE